MTSPEGEGQPIGATLDALGVRAHLDDNEQITEAFVLVKVTNFETGHTSLGTYHSTGLDWISRLGMLAAGQHAMEDGSIFIVDDEDDDA